MDYKNEHFGNPVEAWRQDCDPRNYRHSAEYDELSYPPKVRLTLSLSCRLNTLMWHAPLKTKMWNIEMWNIL